MEGTAAISKATRDQRSWRGFQPGDWCNRIYVRNFIVRNVTPYLGDEKFLALPSTRTKAVWAKLRGTWQFSFIRLEWRQPKGLTLVTR